MIGILACFFVLALRLEHVQGLEVTLINRCHVPIWPAVHGHPIWGAALAPVKLCPDAHMGDLSQRCNEPSVVHFRIEAPWSGRIWPKTGCDEHGAVCDTGGCSNLQDCRGFSSDNTTLVELTVERDLVNYDISLGSQLEDAVGSWLY